MSNLEIDVQKATGWWKTHTLLGACLACFILGAAVGHFFHLFR